MDDWGDREWEHMARSAAAAHDAAFWQVPAEPVAHLTAPTAAQHLGNKPRFKDAFREHPWHTVKEIVTAKGTLAAVGGVATAVVFVAVAVAAFSGGSSDDVTLDGDSRGTKDDTEERGFGEKADDEEDGTTSTVGDTTTAPSTSTTEASTTTSEPDEDHDDQGEDPADDDGDDPPAAPPSVPDTEPPAPVTTAATPTTTTTTTRPLSQPAIDVFDVTLDSGCGNGTVEARFRWTTRNGTSASLSLSSAPGQSAPVQLNVERLDACPRPGDRWTLRVTGPAGTTPATRTITVPSLGDVVD